jgi:hypothetical protein
VTHAELQRCLPAYADGTLADGEAELMRSHLATGCQDCLGDVFTRPVGLPRPQPVTVRRRATALLVAMACGAAALGIGIGTVAAIRWRGPATAEEPAVRALAGDVDRIRAERERGDEEARARLDRLERELQRDEAREPDEEPATTTPQPAPPAPDAEPIDADAVPGWLEQLLSVEGARVMALGAAEFAPGARGYAIWSPARGVVVVSASGLPSGTRQAVYRVRVGLSDGSTVWVGDLTAAERGTLLVTVAMPAADGRRVVGVDLYRDPPGEPVLTASTGDVIRSR